MSAVVLPLPAAAVPQASNSTMRATLSDEPVTTSLIFVVVMLVNVSFFHTRLLPLIEPPGTVAQALPVQYCTS